MAADERGADAVIVFDAGMLDAETPALTVATRGMVLADLDVTHRRAPRALRRVRRRGAQRLPRPAPAARRGPARPGDGRPPEPLRAGVEAPSQEELDAWAQLPPGERAARRGRRAARRRPRRRGAPRAHDGRAVGRRPPRRRPASRARSCPSAPRRACPCGSSAASAARRSPPRSSGCCATRCPRAPSSSCACTAPSRRASTPQRRRCRPPAARSRRATGVAARGRALRRLAPDPGRVRRARHPGDRLRLRAARGPLHAPDESYRLASLELGLKAARALYEELASPRLTPCENLASVTAGTSSGPSGLWCRGRRVRCPPEGARLGFHAAGTGRRLAALAEDRGLDLPRVPLRDVRLLGPRARRDLQRRVRPDARQQAPGRDGHAAARHLAGDLGPDRADAARRRRVGAGHLAGGPAAAARARGFLEEAYFTYSFSPIRGDAGEVAGVFTAVHETSKRVLGTRRLEALAALGEALAGARTEAEVASAALGALGEAPEDVPFAALHLIGEDGRVPFAGSCGSDETHARPLARRGRDRDRGRAGARRPAVLLPVDRPGQQRAGRRADPRRQPHAAARRRLPRLLPHGRAPAVGRAVERGRPRRRADARRGAGRRSTAPRPSSSPTSRTSSARR